MEKKIKDNANQMEEYVQKIDRMEAKLVATTKEKSRYKFILIAIWLQKKRNYIIMYRNIMLFQPDNCKTMYLFISKSRQWI